MFLTENPLISFHVITTIGMTKSNHDSQSRRLSPINAENKPVIVNIARIVGALKVLCIAV
jgi:hypothetical protein